MLEIITGSMFGGKTKEAMARIMAHKGVVTCFVHEIDSRSRNHLGEGSLVTHDGLQYPATVVPNVGQLRQWMIHLRPNMIVIDEVQFFDEEEIVDLVHTCDSLNITMLCVGLLYRSDGEVFHTTSRIMPLATRITEVRGKCAVCKAPAVRSQWCGDEADGDPSNPVRIGGGDLYDPRCIVHWRPR
jgi:thymidine kinase